MGEYASYRGREIKIGTCESMYYLRHDQAPYVRALPGNVDPVKDAGEIRFRFPFPDEDGIGPGGEFEPFDRGVLVPGLGIEGCPEHYKEHGPAQAFLTAQRWVDGKRLVPVFSCGGCGSMWREEDALELERVAWLLGQAESVKDRKEIARRMMVGAGLWFEPKLTVAR